MSWEATPEALASAPGRWRASPPGPLACRPSSSPRRWSRSWWRSSTRCWPATCSPPAGAMGASASSPCGPVGVTLFALGWFFLLLDPRAPASPCAPPPPGSALLSVSGFAADALLDLGPSRARAASWCSRWGSAWRGSPAWRPSSRCAWSCRSGRCCRRCWPWAGWPSSAAARLVLCRHENAAIRRLSGTRWRWYRLAARLRASARASSWPAAAVWRRAHPVRHPRRGDAGAQLHPPRARGGAPAGGPSGDACAAGHRGGVRVVAVLRALGYAGGSGPGGRHGGGGAAGLAALRGAGRCSSAGGWSSSCSPSRRG